MEQASFSQRVLLNRERFTDFEETFSLYVLSNPVEATSRTISDLASSFHIAPNAIMRFSRKIGYKSFSDMRFSLAREAAERSDKAPDKDMAIEAEVVTHTLELCCRPELEARAARMLAAAHRVIFYAVGETAYLTHAFANRLNNFDEKIHFLTYENQISRELERSSEDGLLLVLVSLTGETSQVVRFASEAAKRGVGVITLTDLHPNTLAHHATLALYCCSAPRRLNGITITDLTPLVAALTALERAYLSELGVWKCSPRASSDSGGHRQSTGQ